ncbi:MAG: hypothetical protein M1833_005394 [Piccolia ochrophora]|nr:MAG: hypothetical protein M1833_005394 [Piccolia ochrophora]
MADPLRLFLYKETRLNTTSAFPGATITVRLPAHAPSQSHSRNSQRRHQPAEVPFAEDETAFSKRHLATSTSIYFRINHTYPRSFHWRILEDGRVLSIQSADLSRPPGIQHDAALTLRLVFPNAIRPSGIAFADTDSHHAFNLFVLTKSNDLYTIALRPDFFQRPSSTDSNVGDWCKTFLPSSFSFRYPHRLVARNPYDLLVSLHDGGLLRLTRKATDNGALWTETFFSEGGWGGSLRNLIPWQSGHTIRHGNVNLDPTTAISIAFSPASVSDERQHMLTVGLNHTLTGWNLQTGKIDFRNDLLNVERQPQESLKYLIDPSQHALVDIVDQSLRAGSDYYYVVTYSPVRGGQFKFWAATEGERAGQIRLQDLHPEDILEPQPPSLDIWTMAQFKVSPTEEPGAMTMWILWKNNTVYQIQSLRFDILHIMQDWSRPWTCTAIETLRDEVFPAVSNAEPSDPTDKWLEHFFYPGRYSEATLDTSLSIYEQNLNVQRDPASRTTRSLKDRVCSAVASSVTLSRISDGEMDFERYRIDTDVQWRRYFRIVAELDKQRGEAIALAFDAFWGMPWILTTDMAVAVRECNDTEMLWHSDWVLDDAQELLRSRQAPHMLKDFESLEIIQMASLLKIASSFRDCFTDSLLFACSMMLKSEILEEPSFSVPTRIKSFYERCNFAGHVSDDDYDQLAGSVNELGGFKGLTTELFSDVISTISKEKQQTKTDVTLTTFGERVLVKGAQEVICMNSRILFDLLMLLVFVWVEEYDSDPKSSINAPELYITLLRLLKEYDVLKWLAKSVRQEASRTDPASMERQMTESDSVQHLEQARTSTLLQFPWVRMWKPLWLQRRRTLSSLLTESITHVLADIGLSNPVDYDRQVMWQQRTLLRRGNIDLAAQFLRYQPNTSWSIYIKGRFHLRTSDFTLASIHFKKAAFNLANREGTAFALNETDDLLLSTDREYFNAGLPAYYSHIAELFEGEKSYTYVAEAARLGLQFISGSNDPENRRTRSTLLSRLFSSSVETSTFDTAYSALLRYPDKTLQHKDLDKLLTRMCTSDATSQLLSLPLLSLQNEAEDILAAKCHDTLSVNTGPPYHRILYAWRVKRNDFKGAAEVLHERLQRLKAKSFTRRDPQNVPLMQEYLLLINALASVDPGQAWLLTETKTGEGGLMRKFKAGTGKQSTAKRKMVTVDDVRKEYQEELDRVARIENNQFAFGEGDGDAMDVL